MVKKRKLGKKRKLNENRGKFTNFVEIGENLLILWKKGDMQYASLT